ncbi:MAG: LysE/ArgO family amino acid transporter [Pseudorhodobacter sp.]
MEDAIVALQAGLAGFGVAIGLIAAIGAQNAFVLRQGLRREHVGWVVFVCAASDAVLIAAGVAGFGRVSAVWPWFGAAMLWLGVAFLTVYGALRFRAAFRGGEALRPADSAPSKLSSVVLTCVVLTWANPHVYLDTVVLIGAVSAQYAPYGLAFGTGAVLASITFFSALGFGARLLAPVMAQPRAWVVLEVMVGMVMWAIAVSLALRGLNGG